MNQLIIRLYSDNECLYYDGFIGEYKSAAIFYMLDEPWFLNFKYHIVPVHDLTPDRVTPL